jgi:PAS domain S-box-containing protein
LHDWRVRAEKEIFDTQKRLEEAVEAAELALWEWNLQTNKAQLSDRWIEHLGYSVGEIEPTMEAFDQLIHIDDRPRVQKALKNHLEGATPNIEIEYRLRSKKGDWKWTFCKGRIVEYGASGQPLRVMGVIKDVDKRKLNEHRVLEEQARIDLAIEGGNIGLWTWDVETNLCSCNERWATMLGYTIEEVQPIHQTWLRLMHPDDRERVLAQMNDHVSGKQERFEIEVRLLSKDGEWRWIQTHSRVIERAPDGKAVKIAGANLDITARKKAAEELALQNEMLRIRNEELVATQGQLGETRDKYSNLYQFAPVGYFTLDSLGKILEVNHTGIELLGIKKNRIVDRRFAEFLLPESLGSFLDFMKHILKSSEIDYCEAGLKTSRGILNVQLSGIATQGKKGAYDNVHLSAADLTLQKRAERELRETEKRFSGLFEHSTSGMALLEFNRDDDGQPVNAIVIAANASFHRIMGIKSEGIVGKIFNEFLPDSKHREVFGILSRIGFEGGTYSTEFYIGSIGRHVAVKCFSPSRGQCAVIFDDITERKNAQVAVQESEKRYRDMFENNLDPFALLQLLYDDKGKCHDSAFLAVNRALAESLGKSSEECVGKRFSEYMPGVEKTELFWNMTEAERSGVPRKFEYSSLANDKIFDVMVFSSQKGQCAVILKDVTEARRAQEALRESKKRIDDLYAGMLNSLTLNELIHDAEGKIVDAKFIEVNPAFERMIGKSRSEILGRLESEILPELGRNWIGTCARVALTGESVRTEQYIKSIDKHFYVSIYSPAEGQFAVVREDITDLKKAEEVVGKSEEKFRRLFNTLPITYALFEIGYDEAGSAVDAMLVELNDIALKKSGKMREELIGKPIFRIFPNLPHNLLDKFSHVAATGETLSFEMPSAVADDVYQVYLFSPEKGKCTFLGYDISEHYKLEKVQRENQVRLELALKGGDLGLWDWNIFEDRKIVDERWAAMLGYTLEEVNQLDDKMSALVHPDDYREARGKLERHIAGEVAHYEAEMRMRHKSGEYRWILARGQVVERDSEGKATRAVGTHMDITEARLAQDALHLSEDRLRVALKNTEAIVFHQDRNLRYTWVYNPKLGMTVEGIIGRTEEELFHHEDAKLLRTRKQKVLDTRIGNRDEVYLSGPDGIRCFMLTLEPTHEPSGEISGITGSAYDITDLKKTEQALRETESKFRVTVKGAEMVLFTMDKDLRYTWIYDPKLDLNAEEVIGRRDEDLIPSESAGELTRIKQMVLESGHPVREEVRIPRGSETYIYDLVVEPITDARGQVTGVIGSTVDITNRKKMEQALWKTNELLETMFANIDMLIAYLDKEMNFIRVNRAYAHAEGKPVGYFAGKNLRDLYSNRETETVFHEVIKTGLAYHSYARPFFTVAEIDHAPSYWDWSLTPVKDPDGTVGGLVLSLVDVSKRETASRQLGRKMEELKAANDELQRFAYVASHDLQEPLRMISSYLQLVEERYSQRLDEEGEEFIAFAVDGAKRLQKMINSLLEYSRVETRGNPFVPVSCEAVLNEALKNLQMALEESDSIVTKDYLPTINADSSQLSRVFQNLIGNAIKFRGKQRPHVHISARQLKGEWQFSIKDNGIGINKQYHEKVFVIFQRLHGQEYSGTGIGLSIARRIIERHGGRIWVESEPGIGSTFYFTLPIEREIVDGWPGEGRLFQ